MNATFFGKNLCRWQSRLVTTTKKASDKHGALVADATKQIDELADQLFSFRLSAVWEIVDAPAKGAANLTTAASTTASADTSAREARWPSSDIGFCSFCKRPTSTFS